jgi:hypothetical protein
MDGLRRRVREDFRSRLLKICKIWRNNLVDNKNSVCSYGRFYTRYMEHRKNRVEGLTRNKKSGEANLVFAPWIPSADTSAPVSPDPTYVVVCFWQNFKTLKPRHTWDSEGKQVPLCVPRKGSTLKVITIVQRTGYRRTEALPKVILLNDSVIEAMNESEKYRTMGSCSENSLIVNIWFHVADMPLPSDQKIKVQTMALNMPYLSSNQTSESIRKQIRTGFLRVA